MLYISWKKNKFRHGCQLLRDKKVWENVSKSSFFGLKIIPFYLRNSKASKKCTTLVQSGTLFWCLRVPRGKSKPKIRKNAKKQVK